MSLEKKQKKSSYKNGNKKIMFLETESIVKYLFQDRYVLILA